MAGREVIQLIDPRRYTVGDLSVDEGQSRVSRAGIDLPLPKLSFDLLVALSRAAPNVLSLDALVDQVWPGLVVSPETVSQRVKLLRGVLEDDAKNPRYIVGVRGRGYRLCVPPRPERVLVTAASPRSIAVLPFENLGDSPSDHVISLGVPEAVLHLLASLNEVVVIARTSSFAYQGDRDARSIGQALSARYLLEGSVQSAGGRLRLTTRLIDAQSNSDIWSMRFDRAREDAFALQDEIATQVARALTVSLDGSSNDTLAREGVRLPLARSGGRRASDRLSSDTFPVLA